MIEVEILRVVTDDDKALATVEARVITKKWFGKPTTTTAQFAVDQSVPEEGRAHGGRWFDLVTKEPVDILLELELQRSVKAWMVELRQAKIEGTLLGKKFKDARQLLRGRWKLVWSWLRGPRFTHMTMPMVKRPFPPGLAEEICSVQPMTWGPEEADRIAKTLGVTAEQRGLATVSLAIEHEDKRVQRMRDHADELIKAKLKELRERGRGGDERE